MHLLRRAGPFPDSLFLLAAAACWFVFSLLHVTGAAAGGAPPRGPITPPAQVGRNATFELEGQLITLVDGLAESPAAPESAARIVTRYAGYEAAGDLNGDGRPDAAFVVTQSRGGSGTFYYVVASLASGPGHVGTEAVLLGDRIAPQSLHIDGRTVAVSYATHPPGSPLAAPPSLVTTKTVRLVGATLVP